MDQRADFHISYIANEFRLRMHRNPQYSLRSFARDLGVGAAWLSEFLNHRKGISEPKAMAICQALGLSQQEQSLFVLSVKALYSRSRLDREKAKRELRLFKSAPAFKMKEADFIEIGSWYHQAILELTEVNDFSHSVPDAAKRLGLPVGTVERAIEELISQGQLKISESKWVAVYPETQSTSDRPSQGIKEYHTQILDKAKLALSEQRVSEREFTTATFAFDADRIEAAKRAIRKFQKEFLDEFYSPDSTKDSVYQISMQLFRLDKKQTKKANRL